jgi:hypothetical protein
VSDWGEHGFLIQETVAVRVKNQPKSGMRRTRQIAQEPLQANAKTKRIPLPTAGKGVGIPQDKGQNRGSIPFKGTLAVAQGPMPALAPLKRFES